MTIRALAAPTADADRLPAAGRKAASRSDGDVFARALTSQRRADGEDLGTRQRRAPDRPHRAAAAARDATDPHPAPASTPAQLAALVQDRQVLAEMAPPAGVGDAPATAAAAAVAVSTEPVPAGTSPSNGPAFAAEAAAPGVAPARLPRAWTADAAAVAPGRVLAAASASASTPGATLPAPASSTAEGPAVAELVALGEGATAATGGGPAGCAATSDVEAVPSHDAAQGQARRDAPTDAGRTAGGVSAEGRPSSDALTAPEGRGVASAAAPRMGVGGPPTPGAAIGSPTDAAAGAGTPIDAAAGTGTPAEPAFPAGARLPGPSLAAGAREPVRDPESAAPDDGVPAHAGLRAATLTPLSQAGQAGQAGQGEQGRQAAAETAARAAVGYALASPTAANEPASAHPPTAANAVTPADPTAPDEAATPDAATAVAATASDGAGRKLAVPSVPATEATPALPPGGQPAAVSAAPAAASSTPVTAAAPPPPLHGQVVAALHPVLQRRDGSYKVEVQLDPASLGRVHVSVTIAAGEISVQLVAADAAARDLLRDQSDQLRQQLAQAGFAGGSVDVGDGSSGAWQDPREARPAPRAARPVPAALGATDTAVPTAPRPAAGRTSTLDLEL